MGFQRIVIHIPEDFRGESAELLDMSGYPVLNFKCVTPDTAVGGGTSLLYHLFNQGDSRADDARLRVAFLDWSNEVVGGKEVTLDTLEAGEKSVEPVMLVPPKQDVKTRIRSRFYLGDHLHAEHTTPEL